MTHKVKDPEVTIVGFRSPYLVAFVAAAKVYPRAFIVLAAKDAHSEADAPQG